MRLTPNQVRAARRGLSAWLCPAEMRTSIEQLMNHLGAKDLFNQSGLEFLRDGWAAAEFAGRRGAVSVRLVNADRPDFELMFADGAPEGFELVEGDIEGRKRGLEYKLAAASGWKATDRPIEEWATPVQAYEVLQAASLKKAGKAQELAAAGNPYPPDTNLLIYLNISDFGAHHEDIVSTFSSATEPASPWFRSVWVLWKNRIYQVHASCRVEWDQ
jgi:hypothetical protein